MSKRSKKDKVRVKKVVLTPGEAMRVAIPRDHMPLVATHSDKRIVEIVPVKKKKGWWETLLYGDE